MDETVTFDQLIGEIGSLHMALKIARAERETLKAAVEVLKKQNGLLAGELEKGKAPAEVA